VDSGGQFPVARQCALLGLPRSTYYYHPATESPENLGIMRRIDEEHTDHPFLGVRSMTLFLNRTYSGIWNVKRVRRLMRLMGLEAIYPKPHLSRPDIGHTIHPYLLRDVEVIRPNQVWCSDITYIPMQTGFMYLTAVMDWYSRRVLAWELSNTLDARFCTDALDAAFARFGKPDIFNTDQGSQFTGAAFQNRLAALGVRPSMDGRRRALDNVFIERLWRSVKYEDIYIRCYENGGTLWPGLKTYFGYYNHRRSHQSLGGQTPDEVYHETN
jgi:putative transposase